MERKTVMLENQEYERIDDGLFKARQPFDVNIDDWTYDDRHVGYQAITSAIDDNTKVSILYVSTTGSGAMKLIGIFNDLRERGEAVGFIEGVPEKNAMGEIYV